MFLAALRNWGSFWLSALKSKGHSVKFKSQVWKLLKWINRKVLSSHNYILSTLIFVRKTTTTTLDSFQKKWIIQFAQSSFSKVYRNECRSWSVLSNDLTCWHSHLKSNKNCASLWRTGLNPLRQILTFVRNRPAVVRFKENWSAERRKERKMFSDRFTAPSSVRTTALHCITPVFNTLFSLSILLRGISFTKMLNTAHLVISQ